MLLTTTDDIPGRGPIELLGLVDGVSVIATGLGSQLSSASGAKAIGEARTAAIREMTDKAEKLGADAVVGVRYATSDYTNGMCEIIAYGTAARTAKP